MSRCRYNIIANSSFSWWGAWCNQSPDAVVIAPQFYLGWPIGKWCPDRMAVEGWNYVAVPD